jgi:cobalt-zinc-cadmium efflux system membrane fusion protein
VSDPINLTSAEVSRLGLSVEAAQVKKLPVQLDVAGVVQADDTMTLPILSLVPGRVDEVFVRVGETVKKGEALVSIRSDEVARLESELLEKDLEYEEEEKQLQMEADLTRKVFERHRQLFSDKISAKADLERAENDYQKALVALKTNDARRQASIESTNQRLRLFGIEKTETKRLLASRVVDQTFDIRAPRDGVITTRDVDAGQAVDETKPLMVVSDLSKVWVVAQVFEAEVPKVRKDMPVTASVTAYPDTVFSGKLEYLSAAMNTDTRSLSVRATIDNPKLLLKPEMFARLKLIVGYKTQLAFPEEALQKLGEADIVYVQTAPHTYVQRRVKVESAIGGYAPVLSGIQAGDQVVTRGSVRLLGKIIQRQSQ